MSDGGCALVLQKVGWRVGEPQDLEYWGVDELAMEPCCALKYYPQIDVCQSEKVSECAGSCLGWRHRYQEERTGAGGRRGFWKH